jgi:hypothetical protein
MAEGQNPFKGPYTVEGVVAFFTNERVYYHGRWVGECLHQFLMKECLRLFQELMKFVEKDEDNLFSKAGFNPNRLNTSIISEKTLEKMSPESIKQIWEVIVGKHLLRFFDGYQIVKCAEAGLNVLLSLNQYRASVKAIKEYADNAKDIFSGFAEVDLTYPVVKCLVEDLPYPQIKQLMPILLHKMGKVELFELIRGGLLDWKINLPTFLSLPPESRKVICKHLFSNHPILSELENAITKRANMALVWEAILSFPDGPMDVFWRRDTDTNQVLQRRDASPKRT